VGLCQAKVRKVISVIPQGIGYSTLGNFFLLCCASVKFKCNPFVLCTLIVVKAFVTAVFADYIASVSTVDHVDQVELQTVDHHF